MIFQQSHSSYLIQNSKYFLVFQQATQCPALIAKNYTMEKQGGRELILQASNIPVSVDVIV